MENILRNATFTMIANQGYTLAELPLLLEDHDFRSSLLDKVTNPQVKRFWEHYYNKLKDSDQIDHRQPVINKVQAFLSQPIAQNIIGQSRTTISFRGSMDRKMIVLIPLAIGALGADLVSLLGSVIIGQILNAALSRIDLPQNQRAPFHLYADEYQRFAISDFAELLAEARKFAVATTVAHQWRSQLDE